MKNQIRVLGSFRVVVFICILNNNKIMKKIFLIFILDKLLEYFMGGFYIYC